MALTDWIASKLPDRALLTEANKRSFVLGPGVVNPADEAFGHDASKFSPEEYGNYIATSNGVYACATQRAQYLASLPLKLYKKNSKGERTEVTSGSLFDLTHKVNPYWSLNRLMQMTELARCLWGQSYWFLERGQNSRGEPQEIWWGRPDRVMVIPDPINYIRGYAYNPLIGTLPIAYEPQEVIWSKFPNPIDEYSGLSPLAAARLSADYASAAMLSNKRLFDNGIQAGGVIAPKTKDNSEIGLFTETQAREIEKVLDRRMRGVDKAHGWSVLRFDADMKPLGLAPKEAEFLGGMRLALEDIARAYHWPIDLIGGQRTYENVDAAMKAAWTNCVLPEAAEIAADMTEQLLPMFPGQADEAEFDHSNVHVLQDDETKIWVMDSDQIAKGAVTINEWRQAHGLLEVEWGDAPQWWLQMQQVQAPAPPNTEQPTANGTQPQTQATVAQYGRAARANRSTPAFGSDEHRALWERAVKRVNTGETQIKAMAVDLFERQRSSVINRLKQSGRSAEQVAKEPFDMAQWVREFRQASRPVIKRVVKDAATQAIKDLGISLAFDIDQPAVARFIERRAQRFAQQVNETTWQQLRDSLAEGFDQGEGVDQLMERIDSIMGDKIRSSSETIARTESLGANSGADIEVYRQSGVVTGRTWISAFALRTREDHAAAHGQTVGLDEQFDIGGVMTDGPGLSGVADVDINCLCTTIPEVG